MLKKLINTVEGEEEAEWLKAAGLGELAIPWKEGREIPVEELGAALCSLSRTQAEAVKRRVHSLNHTVKQRYNQRQKVRKPDIREVFKDSEVSFKVNMQFFLMKNKNINTFKTSLNPLRRVYTHVKLIRKPFCEYYMD